MSKNKNSKQIPYSCAETYVINPQKSADPPQPQGKSCKKQSCQQKKDKEKG